ncbi:MAG: metal-dependent transcriptional regulator [Coriobacteriales bacterium]|nr:metal-dependent transcriptional regulator [Coriobacteriales bacterium]
MVETIKNIKSYGLTASSEDYIEAIYELSDSGSKSVRSTDLAASLGVSKASVTKALKRLKENGLIEQLAYGDISITKKGQEYGQTVLQRHIALRSFLTNVLKIDSAKANEEACKMEHTISQETMDKWIAWLQENGIS